ncbi:MAG: 16S rRNA (guanine(527)-N(7))-methyltransferase RsmG [Firmicutes bacterium HGW-Firmicutes-7]|nr:MAG: 16S rRNA (guanine(527)-N(7))-methyltransferase RsmG [Firmicutes bacterium HGW-Firmicutes-7]
MKNIDYFLGGMKQLDIIPSDEIIEQFKTYYKLLLDWNEKINLTSITDEKEVIVKHFLDSLLLVKSINLNNIQRLLDIGTGAGFPGIPLKIIYPHIDLVLLDSVNKKVVFLEEVCQKLKLTNVKCLHGRAEDYAKDLDHRESYDLVVSRAVSKLSTLSEYCIPYVKEYGHFIAYKASDYEFELEDAKHAIQLLGGQVDKVDQFQIPNSDIMRTYVCIKKISATPKQYPRKAGSPAKNPL